jgi:histidinol-phosphate aminotransferase
MNGPQPRPGILDIGHYTPGRAAVAGFDRPLKLSANENAFGPSPLAVEAYRAAARDLHVYPEGKASALRAAIAAKHGLEPERLIFGCGSDELFAIACQALLQPGDNIVQPAHGFAAWAIAARANGGEVRNAPERDLTVDVDALLAAVDERTRIVFLADPANPTGTRLPFAEVRRLHAALPPEVLLLLDGAYAEFAEGLPDYDDGFALARGASNLFVTRTFSKLHGLAALRVGWGYGPQALIDAFERIRLPFNVPVPAQAAALAALSDTEHVARSIAQVRRWVPEFRRRLGALGLATTDSAANFVTVQAPDAPALEAALAARGILVRGLKGYGLPDRLRITIGRDADNERVLQAIEELVADMSPAR